MWKHRASLGLLALAVPVAARIHPTTEIAPIPPRGWSSWTLYECDVNETLIRGIADTMVYTGLLNASYDLLWVDDCWGACEVDSEDRQHCQQVAPRDAEGRIVPSPKKFPSGMKALVDYVHGKGLRIGIYTAVSARTCAGYHGSLGHEAVDADTFVNLWGFDAVKHDTCNYDCGIHDGCLQSSTGKMSDALETITKRPILYYIDSGNPTSPQRIYNPHNIHVSDKELLAKTATSWSELVWWWSRFPKTGSITPTSALPRAHMLKLWFDRSDDWHSMLDNAHAQIHLAEYHQCGSYLTPDYLTVGMGGMKQSQYLAEAALWAVLGAPLFLSNDLRAMDSFTRDVITNPELLRIADDPACVQGSQAQAAGATEAWARPLSDGSFAVAAVNKGAQKAEVELSFAKYGDFYPAEFAAASVRDVLGRRDLPRAEGALKLEVPPLGGRLVRIMPSATTQVLQLV